MASKMLLKHLRTVTTPTRHLVTTPTFTSPLIPEAYLVQRRLYADAAPLAQPTATPPPPSAAVAAASEKDKPLPNAKKVVKKLGSVNEAELAKFEAMADKWWDFGGPYHALHAMNPTRLAFMKSTLCRHFRKDLSAARPFEGLKIVDVGCGGGILSEPLARLGADVTGVDAVEKNIDVARRHADLDPPTSSIEYRCTTAEQLVEEQKKYDVVIASEVIEHVANPDEFCKSLSALTVPGGATLISTTNRSVRGFATNIIGAEYLLRWLPIGTHDWSSFLTPEDLALLLQRASISIEEMAGIEYNHLTGQWLLSNDTGVNFIAFGTKNSEESNGDQN